MNRFFIRVTNNTDGKPVLINADQIVSIKSDGSKGSVITMTAGENIYIKEPPIDLTNTMKGMPVIEIAEASTFKFNDTP